MLWELKPASSDSARWRQLLVAGVERPRMHAHRAVWDPVSRQMMVFGGTDNAASVFGNVLVMRDDGDGTVRWRKLEGLPTVPPGRWSHGMVYNTAHDELIIFGGQTTGAVLYDAWVFMNVTDRRPSAVGSR